LIQTFAVRLRHGGYSVNTVRISKTELENPALPDWRKPVYLIHQIKKTLQFYKITVYNQALCWSAAAVERFKSQES